MVVLIGNDARDYSDSEILDMLEEINDNAGPGEKFSWISDGEFISDMYGKTQKNIDLTEKQKQAIVNIYVKAK